jgi:hypothetical protein
MSLGFPLMPSTLHLPDKLCKDFIKANGPSIFIQRAVQYAYDRTFQETARTFIMFIADFDITVLIATGVQFSSLMVNVLLTNANNSNVKPVLSVIRKALGTSSLLSRFPAQTDMT